MKKLTILVNDVLRSLGFKIVRVSDVFAYRRSKAIIREHIDLVLDIGANSGQYGKEIRRYGYTGQICSFEPLAQPFKQLQQTARRDDAWSASKLALGDRAETLSMNVSVNSQTSSFLPILATCTNAFAESKYVSREIVEVIPLDDLWGTVLPKAENAMLKIDTQGYEAKVISGARSIIGEIKLIECELSFVPLYEGQPLFFEMFRLIAGLGFEPVAFEPVFADPSTGHCLQVDGLFVRNNSRRVEA